MSTAVGPQGQLTFNTHDEVRAWLRTEAPGNLAAVVRVVLTNLNRLDRISGSAVPIQRQAFDLLWHNWPHTKDGDLETVISETTKTLEQERSQESAERIVKSEAARKRARAEQRSRKENEKAHALKVAKLAEAMQCSKRYARMLLTDGTKLPSRAKQMADILGGQPWLYLRSRIKPGRRPRVADVFMRLNVPDCYFSDFARQAELPAALRGPLNKLRRTSEHFTTLEQLAVHAASCGVDFKTATILWGHFKLWRIEAIADQATDEVAESLSPAPDRRRLVVRVIEDAED